MNNIAFLDYFIPILPWSWSKLPILRTGSFWVAESGEKLSTPGLPNILSWLLEGVSIPGDGDQIREFGIKRYLHQNSRKLHQKPLDVLALMWNYDYNKQNERLVTRGFPWDLWAEAERDCWTKLTGNLGDALKNTIFANTWASEYLYS